MGCEDSQQIRGSAAGDKWHPQKDPSTAPALFGRTLMQFRTLGQCIICGKKLFIMKIAQVSQEIDVCPISGNIQGQLGQSSEQCDPVEDVPAHCRGCWIKWPLKVFPTQIFLWFHESTHGKTQLECFGPCCCALPSSTLSGVVTSVPRVTQAASWAEFGFSTWQTCNLYL